MSNSIKFCTWLLSYVVEKETNNITDLVSFRLTDEACVKGTINIGAVISMQSPVKQLLTDALVCAKEISVKILNIYPNILSNLMFCYLSHFSKKKKVFTFQFIITSIMKYSKLKFGI